MKSFKNQKGFTPLEVVLLVLVVGLLVGGGVYIYDHRSTSQNEQVASQPSQSAVKTAPSKTDDQMLTASLTDYCNSSNHTTNATGKFTDKVSEGSFYKVNAGCDVPGSEGAAGFEAYFKKENGGMTFLFATQQTPGEQDGQKYGLPSDWYTTDY